MVRLVWSCSDWVILSRVGPERRRRTGSDFLPLVLFFSLAFSLFLSIALSICPSLPLSRVLFRILLVRLTRSHNWTWQCFRHWVARVNGELPACLWSLECVSVFGGEGGKVMDSAGRSFEGACHLITKTPLKHSMKPIHWPGLYGFTCECKLATSLWNVIVFCAGEFVFGAQTVVLNESQEWLLRVFFSNLLPPYIDS